MYLSRAISSSFVCNACQKAAKQSSQLVFNGTIPRPSLRASGISRHSSKRAFNACTSFAKDRNDPTAEDPEFAFLDEGTESSNRTAEEPPKQSTPLTTESPVDVPPEAQSASHDIDTLPPAVEDAPVIVNSTPPAEDASIPWYLRQQSKLREAQQQPIEIPDLPPNPPPLLRTILEYVSITAGLDDLELLDLRHLDPPPALGPKLIMIIATARSEKHLHVAADTFSRWLRREHGLKANAAGLLGRNELKIKLRRKAKRMRMLANVGGAVPEGNIDDGIRTGWICCTLSKIEAHPDDTDMPGVKVKEFIGFRDVKPGVNVVVQMFTEEKRAETDLETLWKGVMKTHQRQEQAAEDALKEPEELADVDEAVAEVEDMVEDTPVIPPRSVRLPTSRPGDFFPPASNAETARQIRRLHTVGLR